MLIVSAFTQHHCQKLHRPSPRSPTERLSSDTKFTRLYLGGLMQPCETSMTSSCHSDEALKPFVHRVGNTHIELNRDKLAWCERASFSVCWFSQTDCTLCSQSKQLTAGVSSHSSPPLKLMCRINSAVYVEMYHAFIHVPPVL